MTTATKETTANKAKEVKNNVVMLTERPEETSVLVAAIKAVSTRAIWVESEHISEHGRMVKVVFINVIRQAGIGFDDDAQPTRFETIGVWLNNEKLVLHSIVESPKGLNMHVQSNIRAFNNDNGNYINAINSVMTEDDVRRVSAKLSSVNDQTNKASNVWFGSLYFVAPNSEQLNEIESFINEHDTVDGNLRTQFVKACNKSGFDFSSAQSVDNGNMF